MSGGSSPYPYTCELCGEDGFSDETMRHHTLNRHVKGCNVCPFCDLVENSSDSLLGHVNKTHLDYLTPESDLIDYIDNSQPGHYVEDSKQINDTFSYHTPNSIANGWLSPDSDDVDLQTNSNSQNSGSSNTRKDKFTEYIPNNINIVKLKESGNDESCCSNINGIINISSESECGSPSKGAMATAGQGSPLRSQLALKIVKPNTPKKCLPQISPMKQCLMCDFTSTCPKKLEEHMNRAHFDLTSPSYADNANEVQNGYENPTFKLTNPTFQCPICEQAFSNASLVETHLNVTHADILSPVCVDVNNAGTSNGRNATQDLITPCPVCNEVIPNATEEELMVHIEQHFEANDEETARYISEEEKKARKLKEEKEFEMLRAQYGMEESETSYAAQASVGMRKAVYNGSMSVATYYQRSIDLKRSSAVGMDDGASATRDIIEKIALLNEADPNVVQYFLCSAVDHYASAYGDRGWGCGYRNMQMVISSLMHQSEYRDALKSDFCRTGVPSIPSLQKMVERAWSRGFDLQGSEQLGSRLYNTKKWIGACEVVTAFSSVRIKSELIDFHKPTGPNGTHPALLDWVLRYFYSSPDDFKPALYLQHQGHSRTIIGYERHRDGKVTLLILDPSHPPQQVGDALSSASGLRLLRRGAEALRAKQYQVVAIRGLMRTEQEYLDSKVLRSIRIPQDR